MHRLGSKVCDAFGVPFHPFTTWHDRDPRVVVLPHPSGLCRLWNAPGAVAEARQALGRAGIIPLTRGEANA